MNRSPLTKQEISSQFSGCFEGIGCFPGDLCKFHLQPDHQMARHASKKQGIPEEVNEHADWVHSNIFVEKALEREPDYTHSTGETTTEFPDRVEHAHARHFPTHMEMCMDDHFTQTTEGTQQQYLQDISHAEFPSGMENTPSFPGNQFLQGREKHGYRYIYNREHYSEQAPYTQHTHTSRKSSTELPATEDGKFQHGGTSRLQLQC